MAEDTYDSEPDSQWDSDYDSDSDCDRLLPPPSLYLKEIGPSGCPVVHYDVYGWSLNVNSTPAGIGNIMDWEKGFAEVALYERPDIKKRKIVLVGVYPVVRGFAELDRKELADKGQSRFHPLYIEPGHGSILVKLLGSVGRPQCNCQTDKSTGRQLEAVAHVSKW